MACPRGRFWFQSVLVIAGAFGFHNENGFFSKVLLKSGGGKRGNFGRLFYLKRQCIMDRNRNPSENRSHINKRRVCSKVGALEGVQ